jgi:hypothetical protein
MQFFNHIFDALKDILGETRSGRITFLALIIVLPISGVVLWDILTGDFSLRRLEKRIHLLRDLHELENEGIANSVMGEVHQNLVNELRDYGTLNVSLESIVPIGFNLFQFLGGFFLWFIVALVAIFSKDTKNRISIAAIALVVGIILSVLYAIFVPDTSPWGDFLIVFFGQIAFVWILIQASNWRRRRQQSTAAEA